MTKIDTTLQPKHNPLSQRPSLFCGFPMGAEVSGTQSSPRAEEAASVWGFFSELGTDLKEAGSALAKRAVELPGQVQKSVTGAIEELDRVFQGPEHVIESVDLVTDEKRILANLCEALGVAVPKEGEHLVIKLSEGS